MTRDENREIEHVINLWHYEPALWDCSMEMMQFCVTFPDFHHKQTVGAIL